MFQSVRSVIQTSAMGNSYLRLFLALVFYPSSYLFFLQGIRMCKSMGSSLSQQSRPSSLGLLAWVSVNPLPSVKASSLRRNCTQGSADGDSLELKSRGHLLSQQETLSLMHTMHSNAA